MGGGYSRNLRVVSECCRWRLEEAVAGTRDSEGVVTEDRRRL